MSAARASACKQRVWPMVEMMKRSHAAGDADRLGRLSKASASDEVVERQLDQRRRDIPARYAAGKLDAAGGVGFPTISIRIWRGARCRRARDRSVLICHDFDVPSRGDDVNKSDREVPADLPRVDFFHWVMVDIAPGLGAIGEGAVQPRLHRARQARARPPDTVRATA